MCQTKLVPEQRLAPRQFTRSEFVQREEFCKLLLGFRRMIRADEPSIQLRGLLDPETGIRFLIQQEKLWER